MLAGMLRCAILPIALVAGLNAQNLSLRMETETGRSQFRIGEAIGLKLIFETSSPDIWMVTITGRDRSVLGLGRDRFPISPAAGTSDPLSYRLGQAVSYSGPGGMFLHEKTTSALLDLNLVSRYAGVRARDRALTGNSRCAGYSDSADRTAREPASR